MAMKNAPQMTGRREIPYCAGRPSQERRGKRKSPACLVRNDGGRVGRLRRFCAVAELLNSLINRTAGDDGAEGARFGELRGGNLGEIVRKDDEIGVLALFQFALLPFLELRVGGT